MPFATLEFSNRSFVAFIFLQILDVLTTVTGLRMGADEGSVFINRIMHFGTIPALLMSKALSLVLVTAVVAFGRKRLMRWLNFWYAAVVTWNLAIIFFLAWFC